MRVNKLALALALGAWPLPLALAQPQQPSAHEEALGAELWQCTGNVVQVRTALISLQRELDETKKLLAAAEEKAKNTATATPKQ